MCIRDRISRVTRAKHRSESVSPFTRARSSPRWPSSRSRPSTTPLWANSRPSCSKGWVLRVSRPPVEANRMWARKVSDSTFRASRANARSSWAASGALCTSGAPAAVKYPRPVPSGSSWLCSLRLSGASSSQNVARVRRGALLRPNRRHIGLLLRLGPVAARIGGGWDR